MRKCILIFFIALHCFFAKSQATIAGTAPGYANAEFVFKTLSDPFTNGEITLAKAVVDNMGNFSVTIPVKEITQVFVDAGIFRGNIFLEQGHNYIITFPERKEKTKAEKLNPFFEPVEFPFSIENLKNNELNFNIVTFNNSYYPQLEKFAQNIRSRNNKKLLDTVVRQLKTVVQDTGLFFKNYVTYRIGYLKYLAYQQRTKSVSKEYFQTSPVLYNNPAYIELFQQVYNRYFQFFGQTKNGKKIYDDINVLKSYSQLTYTLKTDSVLLGDTLRELVILKNIHDEFYTAKFSRLGLLAILDSLAATTKIANNKAYAQNIRDKVTRLMPGFEPPSFELKDQNGTIVKNTDLLGSYVYLCFCTSSSYACLKEFESLKRMQEKYKDKKLVIITISNDDDWASMTEFVKKSGYDWMFLYAGEQAEVLYKYDVRAYPTYFLIGPDGKLIFSPAISPAEGFELKLFQAMRSRKDI